MRTLLLLLLAGVASATVYTRCEWAKVLKDNGMDGYAGHSLADWTCLTEAESNYDTTAVNHNYRDGKLKSTDYGIFQINSRYWCNDDITTSSNGCRVRCSELQSDVTASIRCAKRIADAQGISAWYGWTARRLSCSSPTRSFSLNGCRL